MIARVHVAQIICGRAGESRHGIQSVSYTHLDVYKRQYNNWLLFRDMVEAFLLSVGEEPDGYALTTGLNKINEWYLSDGWYSDEMCIRDSSMTGPDSR